MKNLFKYEFKKTLITKLIILGITVVAQAIYLIGLWSKDRELTVAVGILLLFFTAMFGIVFIGLQSVLTLHRDMNTKQSYMLFMTPNSCYKILGAKMLENLLSMLIGGAFFFGLGVLDMSLLVKRYGQIDSIMDAMREILSVFGYGLNLDAGYMAGMVFGMLASWFATITAAFMADVVASALLNGKKFSLLISFILFLVLSYAMSRVSGLIAGDVTYQTTQVIENMPIMGASGTTTQVIAVEPWYFVKSGLVSLAFAGLFYVGAAELMQRKLSV
ncbi:MAG: hypothetical protein IKI24_02050 [Clostridia bacterium]|nr:hypothetical protein [Clostridia bacterium]MCR4576481.1 hypothetical protein [Clostridiales bacterium]